MVDKTTKYVSTVRKALVITSSDYKKTADSIFEPFAQSKNDGKQMRTFLEDKWDCEVDICQDKELSKIEDRFKDITQYAAKASAFKSVVFIFLYYSGHGTLQGNATFGHTVFNEPIPIEDWARKLARRQNVFVLAFFDCCRVKQEIKGVVIKPSKPIAGQYKLIFAAKPGSPALGGKEKLSKTTASFLEHFNNLDHDPPLFPDDFIGWASDGEESSSWNLRLLLKESEDSSTPQPKQITTPQKETDEVKALRLKIEKLELEKKQAAEKSKQKKQEEEDEEENGADDFGFFINRILNNNQQQAPTIIKMPTGQTHRNHVHPLVLVRTQHKGYGCDSCGNGIPETGITTRCNSCNFDLCPACSKKFAMKKISYHSCQMQRIDDLTRGFIMGYATPVYRCDVCRKSCLGTSFSCPQHSFDVCPACWF